MHPLFLREREFLVNNAELVSNEVISHRFDFHKAAASLPLPAKVIPPSQTNIDCTE